jgi:AcrR family transcriptional regulator
MVTRQEQKQRTRRRLLDVALELFAHQGIHATRTWDVSKAAGVAHGTVFAHFPTRDDLVLAAIEVFAKQLIDRLKELGQLKAGMRELLEAHLEGLQEHEDFYAHLTAERTLLPPVARNTLLGIQSVISVYFHQAAEREQAQGRIRAVPQHLLFNTWLGLVHHYLNHRELFAPGESVIARHKAALVDHYVGLLTP